MDNPNNNNNNVDEKQKFIYLCQQLQQIFPRDFPINVNDDNQVLDKLNELKIMMQKENDLPLTITQ